MLFGIARALHELGPVDGAAYTSNSPWRSAIECGAIFFGSERGS